MRPPHTTRLHAAIVKANWQFAVGDSKQFRPRVFWANAGIITRFPMRLPARTSQGWLRRPTASVSSAPPARSSLISASHCRWGSLRLTLLATGGCSWQRRFLPSTRPRRRPAATEKDIKTRGQKDTRFERRPPSARPFPYARVVAHGGVCVLAEHEHKRDAALPFDLVGIFRIVTKSKHKKANPTWPGPCPCSRAPA